MNPQYQTNTNETIPVQSSVFLQSPANCVPVQPATYEEIITQNIVGAQDLTKAQKNGAGAGKISKEIKTVEQWFDTITKAAANITEEDVREMMKKYKGQRERRTTDIPKRVMNGFAAIHYAAYFTSESLLQLLMPYEFDLITLSPLSTQFQFHNQMVHFRLAACSTIIHILAMAPQSASAQKSIEKVLQMIQDDRNHDYQLLIGKQNSMGQNATHVALLRGQLDKWWKNKSVFRRELFQKTTDDLTAVMIACFLGREDFMEFLCQMFTPVDTLRPRLQEGKLQDEKILAEAKRCHMQNKLLVQLCKQVETDGFSAHNAIQDGFDVSKINGSTSKRRQCEPQLKKIVDYDSGKIEALIAQCDHEQNRCCRRPAPQPDQTQNVQRTQIIADYGDAPQADSQQSYSPGDVGETVLMDQGNGIDPQQFINTPRSGVVMQ